MDAADLATLDEAGATDKAGGVVVFFEKKENKFFCFGFGVAMIVRRR